MRNLSFTPINAQPIASNTSAAFDGSHLVAMSAIATFSVADAAGTVKIQVSNAFDNIGNLASFVPPAASWVDLPSASVVVAAGATSLIPMPLNVCYRWFRVVWTRTAGTGTITVSVNAQSI